MDYFINFFRNSFYLSLDFGILAAATLFFGAILFGIVYVFVLMHERLSDKWKKYTIEIIRWAAAVALLAIWISYFMNYK